MLTDLGIDQFYIPSKVLAKKYLFNFPLVPRNKNKNENKIEKCALSEISWKQ